MYYVYFICSRKNGTIYVGVTNDLVRRIYEHKNKLKSGFSKKHNIIKLVYFEQYDSIENAIFREKQLKDWHRNWKIELIESKNLDWVDLYDEIIK